MYVIDIEKFLTKNKMMRQDLAEFLGKSPSYISSIIKGRSKMPQKHIQTIIDSGRFDVSMISTKSKSKPSDQVAMDREIFDLLKNQSETILSQQRTIEMMAGKGGGVRPADHAECADVG